MVASTLAVQKLQANRNTCSIAVEYGGTLVVQKLQANRNRPSSYCMTGSTQDDAKAELSAPVDRAAFDPRLAETWL